MTTFVVERRYMMTRNRFAALRTGDGDDAEPDDSIDDGIKNSRDHDNGKDNARDHGSGDSHHSHQSHESHGSHNGHEGHDGHEKHEGHGGHGDHQSHHAHMAADFRRRFWISTILSIPIVLLAPMIQGLLGVEAAWRFPYDGYVQFGLSVIVFAYGGWPFMKGLADEIGNRNPGMMTLIGVAILVAFVYSSAVVFGLEGRVFFWELATLIDIMLLGHWIEMRSVMGASGALEELVKLMPSKAHRKTKDGTTEDVPVSEIQKGDRLVVKPGEKVPTDGVIIEGHTSVNEAMLTGESTPVEKKTDDEVIGGSVNGESAIVIEVRKTGEDNYLSQVVGMVKKAQESRSKTQDTANRAAFWLTIVAIVAGASTLAAWMYAGRELVFSIERMVTVMVITCPHALGLAVPLVVAVSTSMAARRGLLIRDRTAFERARNLDAIVFDKTGTLTEGRFGVTDIITFNDKTEDEILYYAASLESRSEHPIASGIVAEAEKREIEPNEPADFEAIAGKGAKADVDGVHIKVVSPGYLKENQIELPRKADNETLSEKGKTYVYVLFDEKPEGAIALADIIRDVSRQAISRLKEMGIKVMMLTGDADSVAKWAAAELELDDYFAEVLPDEKADKIKKIKADGYTVGMVGDGVNDAPALVEAHAGIAIGAGADVAVEAADIVLVKSNPMDVVKILELSRATYAKMVQNLWWAAGYNALAIPLAAGVLYPFYQFLLPPAIGAVVMSLSTVIVAVNAKLLGGKLPEPAETENPA